MGKMNKKLNIKINDDQIIVENISNLFLENCYIDVKNSLNCTVLNDKFSIKPKEVLSFYILKDDFYLGWGGHELYVDVYNNHKNIYTKILNDKSKCFVLISNDKFEGLAEQLIIGLDKYTNVDILHYTIGYTSTLNYPNLINVPFNIEGETDDAHYMQFSKAPVFLDVISKGYENAVFLDADIQVKSDISKILDYIHLIDDGPILQKGAHNYTTLNGEYIPGPKLRNFLEVSEQKFPHGITNIVIFNKKHAPLFKVWNDVCFSDDIKQLKKEEFLHDELILNCLFWKYDIKPKYFWFALNVEKLSDVKFFYDISVNEYTEQIDLNDYGIGHRSQSFIPYNKSNILLFHCVKDVSEARKINDYIYRKEVEKSFKKGLINFYEDIKPLQNRKTNVKPSVIINFINGAYVEVKGNKNEDYLIHFIDKKNNNVVYSTTIKGNMWCKTSIKYFIDYRIEAYHNNVLIFRHELDLNGKRVFICLDSSSLGDTFAWVPYAEEFRKKHNCEVVLSTFMNELFENQYKNIEFVKPGVIVNNIHAQYNIGWYYNDETNEFDVSRNPINFRTQPLQKTATDILGLEYKEIIPKLSVPSVDKKRKVGIAIHGTAQAKYWNNPTGWQEVVDYLNEQNYEVMLYSRENDGYMGNQHPNGITKFKGGSIQEVIDDLATCEFFIGIGSGLSWLAWSVGLPIVLISGFSDEYTETQSNTYRVINKNVCTGCFNSHRLDAGDWNWCPINKNTDKQFECSKSITGQMVIETIKQVESNH